MLERRKVSFQPGKRAPYISQSSFMRPKKPGSRLAIPLLFCEVSLPRNGSRKSPSRNLTKMKETIIIGYPLLPI
jgi:hypothetical protein